MADSTSAATGLFSIAEIRAIENAASAHLPAHALMQRAGKAAAQAAIRIVGPAAATLLFPAGIPILIAAGPGNNGGDACECAALLARQGYQVTLLIPQALANPGTDHAQALEQARSAPVAWADLLAVPALVQQRWALVIDGLFGIGLDHALAGVWQTVISSLNAIDAPLLALDVPSGLNADTGAVIVEDVEDGHLPGKDVSQTRNKVCIRASHTITFIADKPGLHTCDGRDQAGAVSVASLDIGLEHYPSPCVVLTQSLVFSAHTHARLHNSHKGRFGDVQIIGGADGMVGAAVLAAHAALKSGAGRVLVGFPNTAHPLPFQVGLPELMCRSADDLDFSHGVLVVGPGLGTSEAAYALVARACTAEVPLVLDADGLNLLAGAPALQAALVRRSTRSRTPGRPDAPCGSATLLTPHPLEASRLLGITAAAVQTDRLAAAQMLAEKFSATVILKGSGTIIAHEGKLWVNPTGNPALASGGTGDVLAGLCGALLTQGWPILHAALAAVWVHGAAADLLVARGVGPVGVTASEIIDAARSVLNDVIAGRFRQAVPQ